jgi:aerotaxis receptor
MRKEGHEYKLDKETIIVSETDAKGKIVYANEDFCKIAKFTKDELIGKPHNIVRHPDMPKAAFDDLWRTIQSGKVWKGIVKNRSKDGGYYWVNATVYPSQTPEGEIRYFSVRVRPTVDEIEKAQAQYAALQ